MSEKLKCPGGKVISTDAIIERLRVPNPAAICALSENLPNERPETCRLCGMCVKLREAKTPRYPIPKYSKN